MFDVLEQWEEEIKVIQTKKGEESHPYMITTWSYARKTSLKTALEARLERTLSAKWKETKPTYKSQ